MDVVLMILIGIPIAGVIAAVVFQLRREARDRRIAALHQGQPASGEHFDGNIEARAAALGALMARGGGNSY